VEERLPAIFKPVSLLPYVNDGPGEFLSWVIEATDPTFSRGICAKVAGGTLTGASGRVVGVVGRGRC